MAQVDDRYEMERSRCRRMLRQIRILLNKPPVAPRTWGHVNDMSDIWTELQAIRDYLKIREEE